jgi:hypothetical protein
MEVHGQIELKCKVLGSMPKMFTPTMNLKLTQCISSEELHVVPKSMARAKWSSLRVLYLFLGDNRIRLAKWLMQHFRWITSPRG